MINKPKNLRYARASFLAVLLFLTASTLAACTDGFDALNTPEDEIASSNLDASLLGQAFAYAQFHGMMGQHGAGGYNFIQIQWGDFQSQYTSPTVEFLIEDNLAYDRGTPNSNWLYFFENAAPQLSFVEEVTQEEGLAVEGAMTKVWKAAIYHRITDIWGPIPYTDVGNEETGVSYDSQESVYNNFFTILDEATAVLEQNTGRSAFASDDLLYGGDVNQWLTFANSLRLRLALRVRYVEPERAQQEAEKAVAGGVMTDPSESAMLATNQDTDHPLSTITAWGEFRMGAAMESALEGYEDPRLENYFNPAANGDSDGDGSPYEGLRNGQPPSARSTELNDSYSTMHTTWFPESAGGANPPIQVMRAAEAYFLRAEGALNGWNMGGTAEALYNEGIRTSMRARTGASEEAIEAYVSSSNTPVAVGDDYNTPALTDIPVAFETEGSQARKLEQIITQKWLALYPNGWEAWTEYRRTRYPTKYPVIESLDPEMPVDGVVRRLTFVPSEYDNNTQAVEEALGMLDGPDSHTTRLWWDAK